jgi:transcription elongation factor Elf1
MIKCSKCSASFSVSALDSFHDFAHIAPSNESVTNYQDEWYCYLCVQEDSSADVDNFKDGLPFTTPLFRLNEWGLSSAMPWFLNDDIVTRTVEFIEDDENRVRLEALRIICLQEMSSTLSVEDKLVVIHALCDLLKYNTKCIDHVSKFQSECSKLMKMVTKESIREAELLEIIKSMIGDRATGMLHYFFEGMDGSEDVIRSRVTEGRCGICRGSTFPGDLSEDEHVLLCDRCNGEVHLKCLNRTEVPKGLWHCSSCSEKIALRETALSHAFNDMDQYRSRLVEDDIIDEMIDAKQAKQELSGGHVVRICN